ETDFTLCDFAADMRAPTPSAAAELAVPDIREVRQYIADTAESMAVLMGMRLQRLRDRLNSASSRRCFAAPAYLCEAKAQRLDMASVRIANAMNTIAASSRERLAEVCGRLTALNPLAVLARGYSVVSREGQIVSAKDQLTCGDRITIQFSDGTAAAEIISEDEIQ
ncbi:MAG: exodeoxyribonuclease VII large subunit, partial [Ruminococcaceae bacterium]|nr:exodeoxyribonuclease VII large subunit [Oscillospiraceae bacterium]